MSQVKEVHRLSDAAYRELEKSLPATSVPQDGVQAAFHLGIQHVLATLRKGFVA